MFTLCSTYVVHMMFYIQVDTSMPHFVIFTHFSFSHFGQRSIDRQVREPTSPNWSEIFKILLVLVQLWFVDTWSLNYLTAVSAFFRSDFVAINRIGVFGQQWRISSTHICVTLRSDSGESVAQHIRTTSKIVINQLLWHEIGSIGTLWYSFARLRQNRQAHKLHNRNHSEDSFKVLPTCDLWRST